MAESLVENIEFGETERVWAKFSADTCEQVIKTAGTVVLHGQQYQLAL